MSDNDEDVMEGVDQDENSDVESDEESDEKMEEVDPDELKRQEHARIMKKQRKEQKHGDWKEKKSRTQEGIELGCLEGSEQDEEEQAILEEARARKEPLPLGRWYPEAKRSLYNNRGDVLIDDAWMDDFYESLVKPFKKWTIHVIDIGTCIKPPQLHLAFRFAIRRPLMPEATFQSTFQSMGLQTDLDSGNMPTSHIQPFPHLRGTTKQLICGIDLDRSIRHVSTTLKHSLSRAGSPTRMEEEVFEKEASEKSEVDDTTREIETRQSR